MPDSVGTFVKGATLIILGAYWIGVAILSKRAANAQQQSKSRWGVWILPWALSVDNITYGLVAGVPAHASVWASAAGQALSSAVQAARKSGSRWRRADPGQPSARLPAGRAWRYPALGSRLDGGDGRGLRRDRDDRLVVDEVRKKMGGDRGADQEDGR